ncbi:MAG: hypothetical protein HC858_07445 [Brachymonas sp.]|nr:hypothetical protein [Brachymonas sp.]
METEKLARETCSSEQQIIEKLKRLLSSSEFMLIYWPTKGTPPEDEVITLLSGLEKALEEIARYEAQQRKTGLHHRGATA